MAKAEVLDGIRGFHDFAGRLGMSDEERQERLLALQASYMPFKVTGYYADLIAAQEEPFRSQVMNIVLPPPGRRPFEGRFDPYGNRSYRQDEEPFLQHKYDRTLLLHIDDFCIANCQFCYKVNEIRNEHTSSLPLRTKVARAVEYLSAHPDIDNVLFTGGDPAAFRRTSDLTDLIGELIRQPSIRTVRFATKGLAYDPARFQDVELLRFFEQTNTDAGKQVSVIAQINHPAELTGEAATSIRGLQAAGVQVRGQPALIKDVNDSVETLTELQRRFLDLQIISYYLVIFMPVKGVEQYAMTLDSIYRNVAESKRRLSGLEKKGVLIAPHDFGKLEVCGFLPALEQPEKIVLKWHEAAMEEYLPRSLVDRVPCRPEDLMVLDYRPDSMYCIDHVFEANGLPFIDAGGRVKEPSIPGNR